MDMYSYDPNSRIARRIKERERKRKRNKRIRNTAIIVVAAALVIFGAFKLLTSSITMPEFNPIEGFNRLVSSVIKEDDIADVTAEPDDIIVEEPDIPILDEQVDEPEPLQEPVELDEKYGDAMVDSDYDYVDYTEVPLTPEGYYPEPAINNNLLDIFKNAEGETEKICCLTFDDGPNAATTPEILDILKAYDIKATFFELGERLASNKELAKRTYDEGHLLANHTYTQKYSTIYTSWDNMLNEIQMTSQLIEEITGEPAYKLVRMPGGSFNSGVYGNVKQEYRTKLAENGYYFVDWSVDSGDNGSRSPEEIVNYVKDYCGSKPVILLFEDNNSRKASVKALSGVIEYLKSCGYVFKRLDEIKYYTEDQMPVIPVVEEVIEIVYPLEVLERGIFNI